MKKDTELRDSEFVNRQLLFPRNVYVQAEKVLEALNKSKGLVLRSEKIHLKSFIPTLVEDGVKFRQGKIFTRDIPGRKLSADDKWLSLKAAAEVALDEFRAYEDSLAKTA